MPFPGHLAWWRPQSARQQAPLDTELANNRDFVTVVQSCDPKIWGRTLEKV
jgi:hypothetical protein